MTQEKEEGLGFEEHRTSGNPSPETEKTKEEARELMDEASRRGKGFLDERKGVLARQMETLSGALSRTAGELDQPDSRWMEYYVEKAAEGLGRASRNLRERDVEDLLEDTRHFVRNQPAAFIGGAAAVGFAMSRFLRSSGSREEREYPGSSSSPEERHEEAASDFTAKPEAPENLSETFKTESEEERHGPEY